MEIVIGALVFLMFVAAVLGMAFRQQEKHKWLVGMIEGLAVVPAKETFLDRVDKWVSKVMPSQLGMEMLEKNLRQAGRPFNWTPRDVTVWRVVLAAVLFAITWVTDASLNGHILLGLIFGGVGFMGPYLMLYSYRSMRQAKIRRQLRSFQMMLALLAGTGIRFDQAIHDAVQATSGEFRKILDHMEQRLNFTSTIKEGFAWLADEVGLPELTRLYVVIEQSIDNGTALGDSLQAMIADYDEEIENKIERLSQSVNLKVTLVVLFLIVGPTIGFSGLIAGINFLQSLNSF